MPRVKPSIGPGIFAKVRNWLIGFLFKQSAAWLAPLFAAAGGVIAFLEKLPWLWIYGAMLLFAAVAAVGLRQAQRFFVENSPKDRFSITGAQTSLRGEPVTNRPFGYSIDLVFKNSASFVIEYEVEEIFVSLENNTIQNRQINDTIHRVLPGDTNQYKFGTISYFAGGVKSPLEGKISLTYDYGKVGKAGYLEKQTYNLFLYVDEHGNPLEITIFRTDLERHGERRFSELFCERIAVIRKFYLSAGSGLAQHPKKFG